MPVLTVLAALLLAVPASAAARDRVGEARRWAAFYGAHLSAQAARGLDLAVVDPDNLKTRPSTPTIRVAYVSAGEADERRDFWPKVSGKPFLIEPNPEWPGAHRVDLRSAEWRGLLTGSVVPKALAKGYDGVMFDTLDVAEYFESTAPARFAGSVDAAAKLVLETREKNPSAVLLMNNGLALLDKVEGAIDGLVLEDLYTRCVKDDCGPTPREEAARREAAAARFHARTKKPVFVFIYAAPKDRRSKLVRGAVARAREAGFFPYVAGASLERLGAVDP